MQIEIDIAFEQLIEIAKKLPENKWSRLKQEVEKNTNASQPDKALVDLLLSAPTFSKKQLNEIAKTRKAINEWRTK